MKSENLIHIKLEYPEAVQSKKDILSSQRDLIELLKTIKRYTLLRKEELNIKLKIYKKIKELKTNLGNLHQIIPKIKIPEILKKGAEETKEEFKESKKKKEPYDRDLESQLEEIQERLKRLG